MKLFVLPRTRPQHRSAPSSPSLISLSSCAQVHREFIQNENIDCVGMAGGNLKFIIVFKVFCYFCRPLLIYHFTWNHYSYVVAAPAVWSLVHLLPQDFSLSWETRETLLRFLRWAMICQGRIESIAKRTHRRDHTISHCSIRKVSGWNSKRF